ncbi:proteasome activator complex subunit 3 isoform X2 [Lethenteron reissneri]|uniref:proteasome activator complex subunit 3 isoform X2 n=1 Tax=Lethenteron reissneri TaxID=7753 RepID=UPI002AB6DD34|nr:proteasome activator complex subunit 3 isoform X2 [Lethenteron reissneri]
MSALLKLDGETTKKVRRDARAASRGVQGRGVEMFKERISAEAEDLVANLFPQKLSELDTFLQECLNITDLVGLHSDLNIPIPEPVLITNSHDNALDNHQGKKRKIAAEEDQCEGTKVYAFLNGMVQSNPKLVALIERIKPEIRTLMDKCNTVKMWIQLMIPKIEDGNNFGVSVQEDTVAELRTVEGEAASFLDQISRYYMSRAKLVSKVAKYPHVEDYRRTVDELDEKEYLSLRIIVSELRNHYVILHDVITKNIEKIKKPRSANTDALY